MVSPKSLDYRTFPYVQLSQLNMTRGKGYHSIRHKVLVTNPQTQTYAPSFMVSLRKSHNACYRSELPIILQKQPPPASQRRPYAYGVGVEPDHDTSEPPKTAPSA